MPDRIIRERSTSSPTLQRLSDAAERAWWRLTVKCDDQGRFDADAGVLLARLFERLPVDAASKWSERKMMRIIGEWCATDDPLIHLYMISGDHRVYGHILQWTRHQRERTTKPRRPNPPCGNSPQSSDNCRDSLQSATDCRFARALRESGEERREKGEENREKDHRGHGGELPPNGFMQFWTSYPRKVGKHGALKAWGKLQPDETLIETILGAVEQQRTWPAWTRDGGQYIPHPGTWLNGRRWEDQPAEVAPFGSDLPRATRQTLTAIEEWRRTRP